MSLPEISWRIEQKLLQKKEKNKYASARIPVTDHVFDPQLADHQPGTKNFHINFTNEYYSLNTAIRLLAGFKYEAHKKDWNAGFQTTNSWPDSFSYDLEYKQRDDIGDARTNWELNRHFQFALLAKDYAAGRDERFLHEFATLFSDWNRNDPFLHGIAWTSVMETAIRCSNWCYAYAFLDHADGPRSLLDQLRIGMLNMTDYLTKHYSRYSSANNHLIVEAFAIGQSGILFEKQEWIDFAVKTLTREFSIQNFSDGVNKEQSLHYQAFFMEAVGLLMRLFQKNDIGIPAEWPEWLPRLSRYMADCCGDYGETVVFGDDDEGKILDLHGIPEEPHSYYQYVLGLMSLLLDEQYINLNTLDCETLRWLFTNDEWDRSSRKQKYIPPSVCCYKEGGVTILRSKDRKILIGIDHGPLGFGSICAHAHADALSFQLFAEGQPVFVDPGTYIYHCDLHARNAFRATRNHNTVYIEGKDQSEMLGAFLWGRKAQAKMIDNKEQDDGSVILTMQHDGYAPIIHTRTMEFDGDRSLIIQDGLSSITLRGAKVIFLLGPDCDAMATDDLVQLTVKGYEFRLKSKNIRAKTNEYSAEYGIKQPIKSIEVLFGEANKTCIEICTHSENGKG